MKPRTVAISGVGPGLGAALVRKFVEEGCKVGMFARTGSYLQQLSDEMNNHGGQAVAIPMDLTDPGQITEGFHSLRNQVGPVDVLINHAGHAAWNPVHELTPEQFTQAWRVGPLAGFLCTKEVLPDMMKAGKGCILFTGATSSVRGRGGAAAFSSAKFGLRGLAESLARELWPKGIHVAHVVIDGVIGEADQHHQTTGQEGEPLLDPSWMAEAYWYLATQDKQAWTLELDLRPFNEDFFI